MSCLFDQMNVVTFEFQAKSRSSDEPGCRPPQ